MTPRRKPGRAIRGLRAAAQTLRRGSRLGLALAGRLRRRFRTLLGRAPVTVLTAILLAGLVLLALVTGDGRPVLESLPEVAVFSAPPKIRVRLTEAGGREVAVRADTDLLLTFEDAPPCRVPPPRDGLQFRTEGGGVVAEGRRHGGLVRVEALDGGTLRIRDRAYPGTVIVAPAEAAVTVINELPLDSYVAGVLFREMSASFPRDALLAQAVIARSYAVTEILRDPAALHHTADDETRQVYGGAGPRFAEAERLTALTRDVILWFEGRPLRAYYSSTCGGRTRPARELFKEDDIPPYRGVICDGCRETTHWRWTFEAPCDEAAVRLGVTPPITALNLGGTLPSGHVTDLEIVAAGRAERLPVRRFTAAFGHRRVKSTWIDSAAVDGGRILLAGRGHGHAIGLCQMGARGMATDGRHVDRILAHYYPGATLVRLASR